MKNLTKRVITLLFLMHAFAGKSLPILNSFPSANATVYLDFDGQYVRNTIWNNGQPINCSATNLTDNQINEIFNSVAEDFRPFNINITTDSIVFYNAPINQRIRVIITPTSNWKSNVGGISFIGSFTWGDNTPAFVFADRLGYNSKNIAECCSHETGHTLGLSHQSKYDTNCNLIESYHSGNGNDATSWAPIMGNSYGKNVTGWNYGPVSTGCQNYQDNLSIITNENGFGYRNDDYTNEIKQANVIANNGSFMIDGVISTNTDKDVFGFSYSKQTSVHIEATPFNVTSQLTGSNLDIKITLYKDSNTIIKTINPSNSLSISLDTILSEGNYYFVVEGAGNDNSSNYGSLGAYKFTQVSSVLKIHDVQLSGQTNNGKDNLKWAVLADNNLATTAVEFSSNGINFYTISVSDSTMKSFNYSTEISKDRYYRLKATSLSGEVVYSNMIYLKTIENNVSEFSVATMVHQQVVVNAKDNFKYQIFDANGRTIKSGYGTNGFNRIDMNNTTAGIYYVELLSNSKKEIKRIMKQ